MSASTAVPTTGLAPHERRPASEALKPFAILAVIAFVIGFAGYVALGRADPPRTASAAAAIIEPADAGPASDDWNLPKHI